MLVSRKLAHVQTYLGQDDFGRPLIHPRDGVQKRHRLIPSQGGHCLLSLQKLFSPTCSGPRFRWAAHRSHLPSNLGTDLLDLFIQEVDVSQLLG
jgi:hypothetical protein